ncbi:MAG: PIN domain-containing protein [Proteobacteria bacterium]|nr:PIN domain-containing protein [Pseudomonadota bacterium]
MIAADSCVVIDLLEGLDTSQVSKLAELLSSANAVLTPATLTELLSAPKPQRLLEDILPNFIVLDIDDGYWERAGALRAKVLRAGRKAPFGDALIAQSCIDADVPLLTRDTDFAAFAKLGGLKLA